MNCPHCGAELLSPVYPISTARYDFACGTVHVPASSASPVRGPRCYSRQISQLKAELSQSVRRDDPRLMEIAGELERGSNMALDNMEGAQGEDFIAWEQVHCDFANQRDKLQSIIEGK